jgi:hypothetical protein
MAAAVKDGSDHIAPPKQGPADETEEPAPG